MSVSLTAYKILPDTPGEHVLTHKRTRIFTSGSRFMERLSPTPVSSPIEAELGNADLEIESHVPFLLDGLTEEDLGKIGWQHDHQLFKPPAKVDVAQAILIDSPMTPPMTSIGKRFTMSQKIPAPAPIDWLASLSSSQPPSLVLSFSASDASSNPRDRLWSSLATDSTMLDDEGRQSSSQPLCEKQDLYNRSMVEPAKVCRKLTKRKSRPYGKHSIDGKSVPRWKAKISGLLHLRV